MDCIYEGERMLYIHPDECADCGAAEPACPGEAILMGTTCRRSGRAISARTHDSPAGPLPGRHEPLGSPGGAAKLGVVGAGTPFVARLPREGYPAGGKALRR